MGTCKAGAKAGQALCDRMSYLFQTTTMLQTCGQSFFLSKAVCQVAQGERKVAGGAGRERPDLAAAAACGGQLAWFMKRVLLIIRCSSGCWPGGPR